MNSMSVDRAEEIVKEMLDLLEEFKNITKGCSDKMVYQRFKAYPHGHIQMALTNNSEYMGTSMFPLEDLVDAMRATVEPEEEEGEEEGA